MEYAVLVLGWVLYFFIHSLLASAWCKAVARRMFDGDRYYRIVYSVLSIAGLFVLLFQGNQIEAAYFWDRSAIVRYLSLVVTTFGVMIIQSSFRQYSLKAFLGFGEEGETFKQSGILNWVRHPIYSGLILVTIGYFFFIPNLPSLVSALSILVYLPIGIALEERKLLAIFGDRYRQYCEEVPSIIPKLSKLRTL